MKAIILLCLIGSVLLTGCDKPQSAEKADDDMFEIAEPEESKKEPKVHVVQITGMKFIPDVLYVNKGDTVVWINKDIVEHDVTELDTKSWSSSRMPAGASWKLAVTRSQPYYCSLHVVMRGKIVVDGKEVAMKSAATTENDHAVH